MNVIATGGTDKARSIILISSFLAPKVIMLAGQNLVSLTMRGHSGLYVAPVENDYIIPHFVVIMLFHALYLFFIAILLISSPAEPV